MCLEYNNYNLHALLYNYNNILPLLIVLGNDQEKCIVNMLGKLTHVYPPYKLLAYPWPISFHNKLSINHDYIKNFIITI